MNIRVLVVNMDSVGEGLPLAIRAQHAGHQVKIWYSKDNHKETGKGFKGIERVDNWITHAKWADIVIPTGNHEFMPKMDMLRKNGIKIFGPSAKAANLEIERAEGMKLFEEHAIEVPPWEEFPNLAAAEAHVRKKPDRYVFKTLGDEDDKSLSYVGKSPADMVARLQRWAELGMNPKGPVMLQTFIEGIEIGVSRWVGTEGFLAPIEEDFEHKKFLSGDCGPNCGESGTVLKYVDKSKLGAQVLDPLEDALVERGAIGNVNVNTIIDDSGKAWPLEWTVRLGWPASNMLWSLHKGDPIEWMADALEGIDSLDVSPAIACGIVIAQPDYPYSKATKAEVADIPIYGVSQQNRKYLSPQAVKIDTMPDMEADEIVERPIWNTTGDYIAVATGHGKTVKRAAERAYATVKSIHIPNMIYRDDIGEALKEKIPKLQKHGFVTDWRYE